MLTSTLFPLPMKKIFRIVTILVAVLLVGIGGFAVYLKLAFPKVGEAPDIKINSTPELVQRGEYLALHVAACVDCHSTRDWSYFSGPLKPGTEGKGGEEFTAKYGFPGDFFARNITPAGIGNWTDGEVYRAITCGVSKNGEPFFPVMPYPNYSKMDPEDVKAIIAYLRTLKPVANAIPASMPSFPMNFILRTIPKSAEPQKIPSKSDELAYGKYIFTMAACDGCHTPQEKGQAIKGLELAGGFVFPLPTGGVVRSANITPDMETGIGSFTKEDFIRKFKAYASPEAAKVPVQKGAYNTIMPWTMYAGMTEEDLGALYTYLRTVTPVKNEVVKFTAENTER